MRSWTKRVLVAVSTLLIVAALAGATYERLAARRDFAANPYPGQLVDVGGHRLHIWCTGTGAPPVILDAGLGGSTALWGFVQPEVARFTRVCSYDRAGLGYSDTGPSPRTASRLAHELAKLLDGSGISEPPLIVAASSAGFTARVFASERGAAGLVLVDSSHEDQAHDVPGIARFVPLLASVGVLRLLGMSFGRNPNALAPRVQGYARATIFRAAGYQTAADEIMHIRESAEEVRATRRKLAIPIVVVTGALGADAMWHELQRDLVTLSERGCQIIAEQSSHVVPIDQPEIIVNAIRAIVDSARARNDVSPCVSVGSVRADVH